jgi:hypothetical protein
MAIEEDVLDAAARAYVGTMSSIRGRRVDAPARLALAEDGSVSVCRTEGRGAAADARADRQRVTDVLRMLGGR